MPSDKKRIQAARQKYRMCAGVERALSTIGHRATVADAVKCAGMSRRSFYEMFTSMEDVIVRMQRAVPTMVALYRVERPGVEPECSEPATQEQAYLCVVYDFPHAEPLLLAMGANEQHLPDRSYRLTGEAIELWRETWYDPTPRSGLFMPDRFLLAWYDAMAEHVPTAEHVAVATPTEAP